MLSWMFASNSNTPVACSKWEAFESRGNCGSMLVWDFSIRITYFHVLCFITFPDCGSIFIFHDMLLGFISTSVNLFWFLSLVLFCLLFFSLSWPSLSVLVWEEVLVYFFTSTFCRIAHTSFCREDSKLFYLINVLFTFGSESALGSFFLLSIDRPLTPTVQGCAGMRVWLRTLGSDSGIY